MKSVLAMVSAALLATAVFSTESSASGFRLPDQDAAAMGMAGAFAGQADNPSAVWYNPAGITQLDGTRVSAGVMAIYPVMQHENTDGTTDVIERKTHVPAQLFFTNRINDTLTWGLGLTSPFGLSTNWSETSETRYVATFSKVKTLNVNPNIAYKINENLSVAGGINYIRLEAAMEKMLDLSSAALGDRSFSLRGDGDGWGVNIGAKYKATDRINLGLSYRSRVKISIDGTATINAPIPGSSNTAETDITLPDLVQGGISCNISEKLTINADLEYTLWSTYDRVVIESNTFASLGVPTTQVEEKDWKNTMIFRIGAQYRLSDHWKLRAGYVYDQNPVPDARFDTRIPDSDRQGPTIGTGYTNGSITIDTSYMYLKFNKRTIGNSLADDATPTSDSLNGTYKSQAHLAALTIGYKF